MRKAENRNGAARAHEKGAPPGCNSGARDGCHAALSNGYRADHARSAQTNVTAKSAITALFTALFFLGAGTAWFLQHRSRVDLDRKNQALRQRIAEMSQLAAENERLSNLVAQATSTQARPNGPSRELLRLRGEVGWLRRQSQEAEQLRQENQRLRTEAAGQKTPATDATAGAASQTNMPRESWVFAGYATPEAALQSMIWAISSGDVKTFRSSLTEEGKQEFQREKQGQLESDLAAEGVEVLGKFTAFRVDGRDYRSEGTVILTVSMVRPDGTPQTEKMPFKRIGAEWKLAPD